MIKRINILVTGAGSSVGQGIYKSLEQSSIKKKLFFGDISPINSGLYFSKFPIIIPKVEENNALNKIINIIKKNKIHVIFIGSEYEIEFFSKNKKKIFDKTKAKVCVLESEIIKLSNDKFLTYEFCKKNNITTPKTVLGSKIKKKKDKIKFPLLLKPKKGTSSRGFKFIKNKEELILQKKHFSNDYVFQEFIKNTDTLNELTCSAYVDKNKNIYGPIILKRKIKYGMTWIAKNHFDTKLKKIIFKILRKLDLSGVINLQFMMKNRKYYLIELNGRFSSSTYLRTIYGFNEAEYFLNEEILNKKLNRIKLKKGIVMRYVNEIYLRNTKISF